MARDDLANGRKPRADERLALGMVFGAVGAAVLGTAFVAVGPMLPKRAPVETAADSARTVREDIAADVQASVASAIASMAHADNVVVEAEAVVVRARAAQAAGTQVTLPNGAVFSGEVIDGAAEGVGVVRSESAPFGAGFFVGGVRSGPGVDCQRADCTGQSYMGDFRADAPTGVARIVFADGVIYRGDVRDGAPDGFGELRKPDGGFYRGQFSAGRREGYGVETAADGAQKAGFWKADVLTEELKP
jgi:hypothetical protein